MEETTISYLLPITQEELQELQENIEKDLHFKLTGSSIDVLQHIMAHLDKHYKLLLARTTVSTTLAKATKISQAKIPPEFLKYHWVFSDEEAQWLPKHQPWDHKIDLLPEKQMHKTSIYRLTPLEKITLQEYITEGLQRGTLC